jgi:hypothetical protein
LDLFFSCKKKDIVECSDAQNTTYAETKQLSVGQHGEFEWIPFEMTGFFLMLSFAE